MKQIIRSLIPLLFLIAILPIHAASTTTQLTPDKPRAGGLKFDITSEIAAEGVVRFRVVVTEKKNNFVHPATNLSVVKVSAMGGSINPIQPLGQDKKDKTITCIFTVSEKSLEDPTLCFVLTNYVEVMVNGKARQMPAVDNYYASLKDFFKKQP